MKKEMNDAVIEFADHNSADYKAGFAAGYREINKDSNQYREGMMDGYAKGYNEKHGEIGLEELVLLMGARLKKLEERVKYATSKAEEAHMFATHDINL